MTDTLWFVSPVYFDVPAFEILRDRLRESAAAISALHDTTTRFVVIDDTAGRDRAIAKLAAFDDVVVVTPPFNLGHQRALVYGLRQTAPSMREADIVVTLDADGEDRPEDLADLVAPILSSDPDGLAVALARRTSRQESVQFKLAYLLFRALFRALTGTSIRTGNYAAYRGRLARRTLFHPHFDLCYSATFFSLDLEPILVPCPRGTRYAGRSQMNTGRLAIHGLRMLMPFLDRIALRAFALFGALFSAGTLATLVIIGVRLLTKWAIPGWATYTVLSLATLSLLSLGNFVVLFVIFSQSRAISLTSGGATNERP